MANDILEKTSALRVSLSALLMCARDTVLKRDSDMKNKVTFVAIAGVFLFGCFLSAGCKKHDETEGTTGQEDNDGIFTEQDENILTAAADPWPPFIDPDNPTQGFSMEIIRAALKTQGYKVEMEFVPWARAENGVVHGEYDILPPTWRIDEREKVLLFSDPYAYNEVKFLKRKGDPFEYTGMESLTDKTVGTIRGYGYGDAFLSATNFTRDETGDLLQNIQKLLAGRIDLTLEDEIVAITRISAYDEALLQHLEFSENSIQRHGLHIAVGLKNPRHEEIVNAFNTGLAAIKADGTYARIKKNYGMFR